MADEIQKNVFGQELKDGKVVEPIAPAPAADTAKKDDKGAAPEDIEKNPVVIKLRGEIAEIKKEYGGNLSGQRDKIDRLEARIKALGEKKPEDKPKPLFDKILRVKDLPKEEREAMTETERRLFDENADMKERLNEIHAAGQAKPSDKDGKDGDGQPAFDVNKAVQDEAMKLAEGNYAKATELIERFNALGFDISKLTAETVAERVASVSTLIPDWKPKKEQETANGGAVKDAKAGTGVDAAVAAAQKERSDNAGGNYAL